MPISNLKTTIVNGKPNYELTCPVCSEVENLISAAAVLENMDGCLYCRRYPFIKFKDGLWSYPCPRCEKPIYRKSRKELVKKVNLKAHCACCGHSGRKEEALEKAKQLGIEKTSSNVFAIKCPSCNVNREFNNLYWAKHVAEEGLKCPPCELKERREFVYKNGETQKNEVWCPIPNYSYSVSTIGRVRNDITYKILKPQRCGIGYRSVTLFNKDGLKQHYVHRLVLEAFVPNPHGKPDSNHIDSDRENNTIWNLEWVSVQENANHSKLVRIHRQGLDKMKSLPLSDKDLKRLLTQTNQRGDITKLANELGYGRQYLYQVKKKKLKEANEPNRKTQSVASTQPNV